MRHVRTQIRNAVAQQLKNLSTTKKRVFVSRVYPLESASLPGLIIQTDSDQVNEQYANGVNLWSELQLTVKAYAQSVANLDEMLDQIELEVRVSLASNKNLGGTAKDISWQHTNIQLESGGEQPVGIAEIVFKVSYRVADNSPDISIR